MVRAGLLWFVLVGCGRLGFEPGASGDASADDARRSCAFDLCDDFEAPALDTALWTIDPMITRDPAIAHRGDASARMHVDALTANQAAAVALAESRTFQGSSRDLWVRGWFRISGLPAAGNELELIGFAQSTSGNAVNSVFVRADQVGFTVLSGISASTGIVLPRDTWFCLVWHVRLATSGGAMTLDGDLFDGPDLTGGQTDVEPPTSVLRFGIRFAAAKVTTAQPPVDLWLDDVIVHSGPVTCAD